MHEDYNGNTRTSSGGVKKKLAEYEIPVQWDKGHIVLEDISTPNGLAQVKALIRFYFHVDRDGFEQIAKDWGQLKYALQFDGKLKIEEVKKG